MSGKIAIEICAASIESAIAAARGGAHRIELCSALSEGGLTPSQGMIEYTKSKLKIRTFVLIRPRPGDFNYSRAEYETMKTDIFSAKVAGADGIVIGMLNTDGTVDSCRMKELVEMANPMEVTFHRAFDMTKDAFKSMDEIIKLGCHRILTSGQASSALKGAGLISELIKVADNRIVIMPGSGINPGNFEQLVNATKAVEYHLSASAITKSRMIFRKSDINMGAFQINEYDLIQTDSKLVSEICNLASGIALPKNPKE